MVRNSRQTIYPNLDTNREEKIRLSQELHMVNGGRYFFSSNFKLSDKILDKILEGFDGVKFPKQKHKLYIWPSKLKDLEHKNVNRNVTELLRLINQDKDNINIKPEDVLACYEEEGKKNTLYCITKDKIYSNEEEDNQKRYREFVISDIIISADKLCDLKGNNKVEQTRFGEGFVRLVKELQILNQEAHVGESEHPICREKIGFRKKYIAFLVHRCVAEEIMTAKMVLRLEMIARQLGISSREIYEVFSSAERKKNEGDFISWSFENLELKVFPKEYEYVLYHDMIFMDLHSARERIQEKSSEYTKSLSEKLDLEKEFTDSYQNAVCDFVKCNYKVQEVLEQGRISIENADIVDKIFDSVKFEYEIQKGQLD